MIQNMKFMKYILKINKSCNKLVLGDTQEIDFFRRLCYTNKVVLKS